MTLEEKAEKYVFSNPPSVVIDNHSYFLPSDLKQAYLAGAKELEQENRLLGERCNQLLKDKGDLTDQIADIKANCDLAIEGRDVKIKELEEENNKLLDVINNQDVKIADLEKQIEGKENEFKYFSNSFKKKIADLEKMLSEQYPDLKQSLDWANRREKELLEQIEQMKCCANCKFLDNDYMEKPCCECSRCLGDIKRKGTFDKWEIKEND